jgi:SAM-dependent methyltransferase
MVAGRGDDLVVPLHAVKPSPDVLAACRICGGTQFTPLARYSHAQLVRCDGCRFVVSRLRPTGEEVARHYAGYPRTDFDSPVTRERYRELLLSFESYRETGRILDVGCGLGFFLEEARRQGWEAYGTEYGERAVQLNRAKGLSVVDVSAGPAEFGSLKFDVVTAIEVIEHVQDPYDEIQHIGTLLRHGGLFYCTTPNFNSVSRWLLTSRWSVIEYPEHLNYFTAGTLSELLKRVGFAPVDVTSTGIDLGAFRRKALPTLHRRCPSGLEPDPVGDSQERLRSRIEGSQLLRAAKTIVNTALATAGAGDSLKGRFELRQDPFEPA